MFFEFFQLPCAGFFPSLHLWKPVTTENFYQKLACYPVFPTKRRFVNPMILNDKFGFIPLPRQSRVPEVENRGQDR
jgi:hypothetical protein